MYSRSPAKLLELEMDVAPSLAAQDCGGADRAIRRFLDGLAERGRTADAHSDLSRRELESYEDVVARCDVTSRIRRDGRKSSITHPVGRRRALNLGLE